MNSLTLNDVKSLVVGDSCRTRNPCGHDSTLTLNDGRMAFHLNSFQICSLVTKLAQEKINPDADADWKADSVREHFKNYNQSRPSQGWFAKPADIVLNELFGAKITPSFDVDAMFEKARKYSDTVEVYAYIKGILWEDKFQIDPKAYLDEHPITNDDAKPFFEQNFKF